MTIHTPEWVRDAVFYQVFPDRFAISDRVAKPGPLEPWDAPPTNHGFKGGDLLGVVEHLPYLQDLGVNALYLTPIFQSASNHRYHTYDYLTVDPLLGGDAALRELLDEAHARDMRVVLDGVFNHTGRGFWAFHHALENGAGSPYRDWFHWDPAALDGTRPVRPYPFATDVDEAPDEPSLQPTDDPHGDESVRRLGYRAWWGLPALPKLNTSNPEVREHLLSVAEHWLRFGIDGWRLDVPTEIKDEAFWQEFRRRSRAINPDAYIVGEIWHEAPAWLAGDRFDAVMNYPLAEAILGYVAQGHLNEPVVRAHHEYGGTVHRRDGAAFGLELERLMGLYDRAVTDVQLNLLGSHDSPRFRTMASDDRASYHLAVAAPGDAAGRAVHVLRRRGRRDRWQRPRVPARDAVGRDRVGPRRARLDAGGVRRPPRAPEPCAGARSASWARRAMRSRSCVTGDSGGDAVLVAVNAGDQPVEVPAFAPQLGGATLRDVPLPDTRDGAGSVTVEPDGRLAVPVPPRTGRIMVRA